MTSKPGKSFDLSAFNTVGACDKAVEMELLVPVSRKPSGMFISVFGKDSLIFKEHLQTREDIDRRRAFAFTKKNQAVPPKTAEETNAEGTALLAACTAGFRNLNIGGTDYPFSTDNAMKLYADYPAIREQVDAWIVDLELFMKG